MLKLEFLGDEVELDSLNGYYRLNDLGGPDPRVFMNTQGPHTPYSIQLKRHVWCNMPKVIQYCSWADPVFKEKTELALKTGNLSDSPITKVERK